MKTYYDLFLQMDHQLGDKIWLDNLKIVAAFRDLAPNRVKDQRLVEDFCTCGALSILLRAKSQAKDEQQNACHRAILCMKSNSYYDEDLCRAICQDFFDAIIAATECAEELNGDNDEDIPTILTRNEFIPKNINDIADNSSYCNERRIQINPIVAIQWLSQNAESNVEAKYWLGYCYDRGYGTTRDESVAIYWYEEAAKAGHIGAQYLTGAYYILHRSDAERKDIVAFLESAANNGHIGATRMLAICYHLEFLGCGYDEEKALKLYSEAANAGDVEAQKMLYKFYLRGDDVVKEDSTVAFQWLEKAAQQGDLESIYDMAVHYRDGDCVAPDYGKAMEYLEMAISKAKSCLKKDKTHFSFLDNRAYENAEFILKIGYDLMGEFYLNGVGVEQNDHQAAYYFTEASKRGCYESSDNLAKIARKYFEGKEVEEDFNFAFHCLSLALEDESTYNIEPGYGYFGKPEYGYMLGWCYFYGKGTSVDYRKAFFWFYETGNSDICTLGNYARSRYMLGVCYKKGYGCKKDESASRRWIMEAKQSGIKLPLLLGHMPNVLD